MSAFGFSVASLGEVWVVISICAATLVAWAAITLARRAESSVRTGTARRIGAEEAESHQHGRSSDTGDAMADSVTVTGIRIYPIKSCAGISLDRAHVTPTGFAFDRQWMVVHEDTGKFITQRQEPKLALVKVELPQQALDAAFGDPLPRGLAMRVSTAKSSDILEVPLDPPPDSADQRQCNVWEWKGPAADMGDGAAAWFSAYLGKPVRLVRYAGQPGAGDAGADPKRRETDAEFAPAYETAFADGFPYLLISEGSLEELNKHMPQQLPMNRFRPNIVVSGTPPFAEDGWRSFSINQVEFDTVKPCSRCKLTTVDQAKAVFGKEPLEALHSFRSGSTLGWAESAGIKSWRHAVFFGENLVTRQSSGTVTAGDAIIVTATRDTAGDGAVVWKKNEV